VLVIFFNHDVEFEYHDLIVTLQLVAETTTVVFIRN
jgi:hypothetical protein